MASVEEVKKLAALARVKVSDEELPKFTKEFEAILAYVGQLEKIDVPKEGTERPALRNVFREDTNPTESGTWTKKLVAAFPYKEGDALVVKQVIAHE